MANKPIIMSKVRQILKLYAQHMGKKKIAIRLGMSKNGYPGEIDHLCIQILKRLEKLNLGCTLR